MDSSYLRTFVIDAWLVIVIAMLIAAPFAALSSSSSDNLKGMDSSSRFDHRGAHMQVQHISAARGVVAGALTISAHYKFDMDLTSFLWNAAGNPLWSSVYCTYRGIELASRFTTATLASSLVVVPQVSVWSPSCDLQSFSKALCSPVVAEVLKVQALCSPLAEVEKPELFAVYVTGLKFENALKRNDVNYKALCSPRNWAEVSKVPALCSPRNWAEVEKLELLAVHVTGLKFENALTRNDVNYRTLCSPCVVQARVSRSLEGIECVTTLMNSAMTSTRYDWKSIPQYGKFFVCRLTLISATSVVWNSSGSATVYGLHVRLTDHRNFFPEPSLRKGAKWNPQPEHMVKYQKVHLTQSDFLIFSPVCLNMVCLNKSLSLGLCDPRRCMKDTGDITPVYPGYECNAVVQLYWAPHGTEGSNPECKYSAGARLFRTQRGTKGYCLGALPKCKYSVVRSSRTQPGTVGYHLGKIPYDAMYC